ncbi:MAG: hypothetical protein KC435_12085 [Thermomicrobiales bacterium]|nr:hypothetical protein [Thermomicrobiales bacterium]
MNRRTFVTASVAIVALGSSPGRIAAQETAPVEATWDSASQLFGNAWDLLPHAEEGKAELLSTIISPEGSSFGFTQLFGLIHNNSDNETGLTALGYNGGDLLPLSSTYQSIIAPHGYALMTVSTTVDFSAATEPLTLAATFGTVDEVKSLYTYSANVPLGIDTAEFTDEGIHTTLTNTTETDVVEAGMSGLVMWFDDQGIPINVTTLGSLDGLKAGATYESENYIFTDFDVAAPFLIGYYGLTG